MDISANICPALGNEFMALCHYTGRLSDFAEVTVPNSTILTGLCSHVQVHPTVVPQKEDVDLFTVCSFLFKPTQSPESSGSIWNIAASARRGAHQADTHTAQHKLESKAWQSFIWEAAILDTPQHQSDFAK